MQSENNRNGDNVNLHYNITLILMCLMSLKKLGRQNHLNMVKFIVVSIRKIGREMISLLL